MSRPEFKSGFADEINKYIDFKVANGYKEKSYTILLHEFDRFCVRRGLRTFRLPEKMPMHGLKNVRPKRQPPIMPE